MKFFGEPNMLVRERRRKPLSQEVTTKPLLRFDNNGEYETDDPRIIAKLKRRFRYEEAKILHCTKCDFTTHNTGILLQHYQKEHPKDKEGS